MGLKMEIQNIEIITDRLIIRRPMLSDAEEINAALNEVWRELQVWMSWAHQGENTLEKTRAYISGELISENLPLVGFCRENGCYVVSTGLFKKHDGVYETGYWVAKDFLGQGYATEACAASIRIAFETMQADRVFINYFEGNEKSRRVIEKLGFRKTGVLEKHHARCIDGTLLDEHQYEMTIDEWRQRCP